MSSFVRLDARLLAVTDWPTGQPAFSMMMMPMRIAPVETTTPQSVRLAAMRYWFRQVHAGRPARARASANVVFQLTRCNIAAAGHPRSRAHVINLDATYETASAQTHGLFTYYIPAKAVTRNLFVAVSPIPFPPFLSPTFFLIPSFFTSNWKWPLNSR